jgi:20S proteasome alpha/beta subunit
VKAHNKKSKEKISVKKVEKVIKKHCQEKKQPYIDNRYCWITGQTAEEIQKK